MQVLLHIIPTGGIYHMVPNSIGTRHVTDVQRIRRISSEASTTRDATKTPILSISRTCKRLNEVVNNLFYGQNQFVFEIAIDRLTSMVKLDSSDNQFETWTRAYNMPPTTVWPVTVNTARFLTDATFMVSHYPDADHHEQTCLERQLRRVADVFRQGRTLKCLCVILRPIPEERKGSCCLVDDLHVSEDKHGMLRAEVVSHGATQPQIYSFLPRDTANGLGMITTLAQAPNSGISRAEEAPHVHEILKPFEGLYGL